MIPQNATIFKDMNLARRPLSRLSYQIMGLNLIAVIILVMGIFYLDSYRKNLTATETELLATETELYATVIGNEIYKKNYAIAKKLAAQKNQRIRLYDQTFNLIFDSETQSKSENTSTLDPVFIQELPLLKYIYNLYQNITAINFKLPLYPDGDIQTIQGFFNDKNTLKNLSVSAWQNEERELILVASTPVINNKNEVVAYLVVTRFDTNIVRTFEKMRADIFILFIVSLIITIVFSLYLSANIGHPLRFLASAAEAAREKRSTMLIPDLSYRKDEIGDLSIALRSMTHSLIERVNTIEQFAADVAHELKNPLTSIKSALETLDRIQDHSQKQTLRAIISHDLTRMDRLITTISHASRLDAELAREDSVPVDIIELLNKLQTQYQQQNLAVKCDLPIEAIHVWGSAPHLSQIFQNIFDNGLSFGSSIYVSVKDDDEKVAIYCRDNGCGIPDGKEGMIFKRFYTDRASHDDAYGEHSGLGLSIALQIAQSHGGDIKVTPNIAEGAEFIVFLRKVDHL